MNNTKKISTELKIAIDRITDALEMMNREPDEANLHLHAARGILRAISSVLENEPFYLIPTDKGCKAGGEATSNKTVFSLNEEIWYDDWSDIIDQLECNLEEGETLIGQTYYEGEKVDMPMSRMFNIDHFIDALNEKAWDEVGEYADEWPDFSESEKKELESFIVGFLEKHAPALMDSVINIKEMKIIEGDL